MKLATCHTERKHHALGFCKACYYASDARKIVKRKQRSSSYGKAVGRIAYYRKTRARTIAAWRHHLKKRYKITPEDYDALIQASQGCCYICSAQCSHVKNLSVDHDHKTGAVRGLLCSNCNVGLGALGDTYDRVRAAADYLRVWSFPRLYLDRPA